VQPGQCAESSESQQCNCYTVLCKVHQYPYSDKDSFSTWCNAVCVSSESRQIPKPGMSIKRSVREEIIKVKVLYWRNCIANQPVYCILSFTQIVGEGRRYYPNGNHIESVSNPPFVSQYSATRISSGCTCPSIPTPTITTTYSSSTEVGEPLGDYIP